MSRVEGLMAKMDWDPRDRFSPAALDHWAEYPKVHQRIVEVNQLSRELCEINGVSDTLMLPFEARERLDAAASTVLDSLGSEDE